MNNGATYHDNEPDTGDASHQVSSSHPEPLAADASAFGGGGPRQASDRPSDSIGGSDSRAEETSGEWVYQSGSKMKERWVGERFEKITARFSDLVKGTEDVVRAEIKLVEAKALAHVRELQASAVRAALGTAVALSSYVFALLTIFFALHETFPEMPLWAISLILTASTRVTGIVVFKIKPDSEE